MNSNLLSTNIPVHPLLKAIGALLLAGAIGVLTFLFGFWVLGIATAGLALAFFVLLLFHRPDLGVYTALTLGFGMTTIDRYIMKLPVGLIIELVLVFTYLILFLKYYQGFKRMGRLALNDIVLVVGIWAFYILLQAANPQAVSMEAWAYAMRGIALIPLLAIPMGFILLNTKRDWNNFLNFWLILGAIAILYTVKQDVYGLNDSEKRWLASGAASTHMLFGKLRYFSIYTDAGTFGAGMGQLCAVALILVLGPYARSRKLIFALVGLGALYAMFKSGTRGAMIVPAVGGMIYTIMVGKPKHIILAGLVLLTAFSFLRFTSVGHSTYAIHRMRSAVNPTDDPSFKLRLANRDRLTEYLKDKPFGGGVGSVGNFGYRFSPGTWLSTFAPDGLYTRIRAETGIVGMILFLSMWLYILFRAMRLAMREKNPEHKNIMMALIAGYAGMLAGNYTNEVMTQFPNNLLTFFSIAVIFSVKHWKDSSNLSSVHIYRFRFSRK